MIYCGGRYSFYSCTNNGALANDIYSGVDRILTRDKSSNLYAKLNDEKFD